MTAAITADPARLSPPAAIGTGAGRSRTGARLRIASAAAAALLLVSSAVADEAAERAQLKLEAAQLLKAGDLAGFDRRATELRLSRERSRAGIWKLSLFYNGVEQLPLDQPQAPLWTELEAATERHLAAHPESPAAVVITARVLAEHAWAYRGDGYARTLSDRQRIGFADFLGRARQVLEQHQAVGRVDPQWFALRIGIMNWQGDRKSEILKLADAALAVEPTYQPTHYMAAFALLPKWGGSAALLQQYLAVATRRSAAEEGAQVYARVMFNIARWDPEPYSALTLVGVDWPRLAASLGEISAAYPDGFNLNAARALACLIGTEADYTAAAARVGAERVAVAWFDTAFSWAECRQRQDAARQSQPATILHALATTLPAREFIFSAVAAVLLALAILGLARRSRPGEPPPSSVARTPVSGSVFPRVYRMSILWKAVMLGVCTVLALGALAFAWYFGVLSPGDLGPKLSLLVAFVAVGVASGAVIGALDTLVSTLVLDADALEIHELLRVRRIARTDIASRQTLRPPNSPPVLLLKFKEPGRRRLKLPMTFDIDRDWTAWFAAIPDADAEAANAVAAEIEANTELGATPAERNARVARAQRIAQATTWIAGGVLAWAWFYPRPLAVLVPVLAALPWIGVGLIARSPGVYVMNATRARVRPDLTALLVGPGMLLTLRAVLDVDTLDWQRCLILGAIVSAVLVASVVRAGPADRSKTTALIVAVLLLAPYGYGACAFANVMLDRAGGTVYQVPVLGKHASSGRRATTRNLTLAAWGPRSAPEDVAVSRDSYEQAVVGQTVCVELRPGALRIRWIRVSQCLR